MRGRLSRLNRRAFLRGAGVAMALPLLEAMRPLGRVVAAVASDPAAGAGGPMRLVCIGNPLGMLPEDFFPATAGADYAMPELLKPMAAHRSDFTIFSNLDHDVNGGHRATHAFLSGLKDNEASEWPERNISVDQRAAEFVGARTRFPSIVASPGTASGELANRMSWTRNGVNIPPITRTKELFRALFVTDNPTSVKQRADAYDLHASILDAVNDHAKLLEQRLGRADQQKLEEYLTSVREVETKLGMSRSWLDKPKPKVDLDEPAPGAFTHELPMFLDLAALAIQTDSTRVFSLGIPASLNTSDLGLSGSYHGFSHHGKAEVLRRGLMVIEKFQMEQLSRFVAKLKAMREPDGATLLDRTMVLFGSGMGNGSSHSNRNLPILLAGGGFRHGEHKVYPDGTTRRIPLCNLYTSMLQRFGVEIERFNTASGTLSGLEIA